MKYLTIFLQIFIGTALICQSGEISTVINTGVSDGLASRNIINTLGDSTGAYFIQTPSTIQKYFNNQIIHTLNLDQFDASNKIIQSAQYLFRYSSDNCILTIDKDDLTILNKMCLPLSNPRTTLRTSQSHKNFNLLSKLKESTYELIKIQTGKSVIPEIMRDTFNYHYDIKAFNINSKGQLFLIDEHDTFSSLESKIKDHNYAPKPAISEHDPFVYVSPTDEIFYSLMNKQGIYRYSSDSTVTISTSGHLLNLNWDNNGNALIGITNQTRLHQDSLIFYSSEREIKNWSNLLKYNNRIINIYSEDFNKYILASTYNGLYFIEMMNQGFEFLLYQPDLEEEDFGYFVRSFTSGPSDEVFLVKEGGDPIYICSQDSLRELNELTGKIGFGTVDISYDTKHGKIWILQYHRTGSTTLICYDTKLKTTRTVDLPFTGERMHLTSRHIWITGRKSQDGKIARVNRLDFTHEMLFEKETKNRQIRSSYFTDSLFLFGTRRGLLLYDPNQPNNIKILKGELQNESISHITKLENSYLVGIYGKGLALLGENFELMKILKVGNSASSNTIASIEEDYKGNVWVSTFDGIVILNSNYEIIKSLFMNQSLSFSEFNRAASIKDDKGNLFFGNTNGFLKIDPKTFYEDLDLTPIILKSIQVANKSNNYNLSRDQYGENKIFGKPKEVTLTYFSPNFYIKKNNPHLDRQEIIIEPRPKTYRITDHSITIHNPEYGEHKIYAQSKIRKDTPKLISSFTVSYHISFWRRMTFAFLLSSGLSYLIALWYIKRLREKNKADVALAKKFSEIKLESLRSQLNPHFVFNALNSIQYYIQTNEKALAREYLNKFSNLMRYTLESSHFNKISLRQEIEQLKLYIALEMLRFENRWTYSIITSEALDINEIKIPSMLIQPLVENAIKHGLATSENNEGRLVINFEKSSNEIIISIDDNGIGRKLAYDRKSTNNSQHVSLSTKITNERISTLNSIDQNNITLHYLDKVDIHGKPTGTTVFINIKYPIDE